MLEGNGPATHSSPVIFLGPTRGGSRGGGVLGVNPKLQKEGENVARVHANTQHFSTFSTVKTVSWTPPPPFQNPVSNPAYPLPPLFYLLTDDCPDTHVAQGISSAAVSGNLHAICSLLHNPYPHLEPILSSSSSTRGYGYFSHLTWRYRATFVCLHNHIYLYIYIYEL